MISARLDFTPNAAAVRGERRDREYRGLLTLVEGVREGAVWVLAACCLFELEGWASEWAWRCGGSSLVRNSFNETRLDERERERGIHLGRSIENDTHIRLGSGLRLG